MTSRDVPIDGLERTTIEGDVTVDLRDAAIRFGLVERSCRTRCASGERFEGRWRGISVADLLADVDPGATHILVDSADGFRVCIDVIDALDGIVALERLDDGAADGLPRLVVPGCLGTRMVKRVTRIDIRCLDSTVDPEELERIDPAETSE